MIKPEDWRPVTADEPKEDDPVLVYNGIRAFATKFKQGLVSKDAPYPVTHFCAIELPYVAKAEDITGIDPGPGRQRLAKGSILTCIVPDCGRSHHAKGLCLTHYMRRG